MYRAWPNQTLRLPAALYSVGSQSVMWSIPLYTLGLLWNCLLQMIVGLLTPPCHNVSLAWNSPWKCIRTSVWTVYLFSKKIYFHHSRKKLLQRDHQLYTSTHVPMCAGIYIMSIEYVTYVSSQKIVLCTNKYRVQIVLHVQEYYDNNLYKICYKCHCHTFESTVSWNKCIVSMQSGY